MALRLKRRKRKRNKNELRWRRCQEAISFCGVRCLRGQGPKRAWLSVPIRTVYHPTVGGCSQCEQCCSHIPAPSGSAGVRDQLSFPSSLSTVSSTFLLLHEKYLHHNPHTLPPNWTLRRSVAKRQGAPDRSCATTKRKAHDPDKT